MNYLIVQYEGNKNISVLRESGSHYIHLGSYSSLLGCLRAIHEYENPDGRAYTLASSDFKLIRKIKKGAQQIYLRKFFPEILL